MESSTQRRRRRASTPDDDAGEEDFTVGDVEESQADGAGREQMVKKMVRLALACEYARQPIRRADIGVKGNLSIFVADTLRFHEFHTTDACDA